MTRAPTVPPRAADPLRLRRLRTLCLAVPAAVLAACYLWLALDHGTLALWNVTVHESGRHTLGGTIFYFAHFLREIPTVVAYVLFLLSVSAAASPPTVHVGGRRRRIGAWLPLAAAAALGAIAFIATALPDGVRSALLDLLQYRTRDELSEYGSHWRFHWLSTLWFGSAAALAPVVAARITGAAVLRPSRFWMIAAWGFFLGLTLVFGISGDVFSDVRYTGHQAREILTHAPVTLLLGLAVLLAGHRPGHDAVPAAAALRPPLPIVFGLLFLLIPGYLAVVTLSGDVMAHGQSQQGLGGMVAAHYFEHSLDYLAAFLLLVAGLDRGALPTRQVSDDAPSELPA